MDNGCCVEGKEKSKTIKYKGKHDKPKPWDNEIIDHWKVEKFNRSWNEGGMLEVSCALGMQTGYNALHKARNFNVMKWVCTTIILFMIGPVVVKTLKL